MNLTKCLSIQQIEELKLSYQKGDKVELLATKYNLSESYIRRILWFLKIKRPKELIIKCPKKEIYLKYPKILSKEKEIIELYINKQFTISDLIKKFNIPRGQFNHYFNHNNILINRIFRNFSLNENYFKIIDSKDKAYFLGLIYSDGWVLEKTHYLGLALVEKTPILLETLNKAINSTRPIKKYKSKTSLGYYYRLDINSEKIIQDLKKLGIIQNKTFLLKFPTPDIIPLEYFSHFIRGIFDGDGSGKYQLKNNKTSKVTYINFLGTLDFCSDLLLFLRNTLNITSKNNVIKNKNIYSVTFGNKKDIKTIFDYIYKDKDCYYLERKFIKFIF